MQRVINCGSVLQAYSLKKMIEDISESEVDFLDPIFDDYILTNMPVQDESDYYEKPYIANSKAKYYCKKIVNKYKWAIFKQKIKIFQKDVLKLNSLNNKKEYDVVVEGSDEVFKSMRRVCLHLHGELDNAKKIITYASSCGSAVFEGIPKESVDEVKKAMSNFEAMSVRDDNTYRYVEKLYSGKIDKHLDPVLVGGLSKHKHNSVNEKKYILVYGYGDRIRSKEEIEPIKKLAKDKNLKTIAIGSPQYWCDKFIPTSPFETLDYFYNAEYVITDTFHGTVFSIINNCQFAVILRKSNENKINMLLEQLGLKDRMLEDMQKLADVLDSKIEYDAVDKVLEEEKERSYHYLKDNILS